MHTELSVYTELVKLTGFASSMRGGRPENQDDLGFLDTPLGFLFVLCDGMGGGPGGKMASDIVKREIIASVNSCNSLTPPDRALSEAFIQANEAIEKKIKETPSLDGMGSTAVALIVGKQSAFVAHVGDSRLYHFRKGELLWRTTDHSLVNDLVQLNALTEEQARTSPQSNVITRGLGATNNHTPDISEIVYEIGDRLVLCSDGVWGMMPAKELLMKFTQNTNSKSLVKSLQDEIDRIGEQQGGGHDNHTIAVIDLNENSQKELNMIKKLKAVIGVLCVLCCVLLISFIVSFMNKNTITEDSIGNDKYLSEMLSYKHKYEALSRMKKDDAIILAEEIQKLKDSLRVLNEENNTLNEKLRKIEAESKTNTGKSGRISVYTSNTTTKSPKKDLDDTSAIINEMLNITDGIIKCQKTEQKAAVVYIDDSYNKILELLNRLDEITNKYKVTTDGIRRYMNNSNDYKNYKNKVERRVDKKKGVVYYVPTNISSQVAQTVRDKISNLKV